MFDLFENFVFRMKIFLIFFQLAFVFFCSLEATAGIPGIPSKVHCIQGDDTNGILCCRGQIGKGRVCKKEDHFLGPDELEPTVFPENQQKSFKLFSLTEEQREKLRVIRINSIYRSKSLTCRNKSMALNKSTTLYLVKGHTLDYSTILYSTVQGHTVQS